MTILLDLFLTFAKIGLFTFGGGYAMIAIIEDNCVERRQWLTHDEMMNITVIAESTPGPIAINCATFTGYKKAGLPGAIAATIGVVVPSFLIIYPISIFLDHFLEITVIANGFNGIKIAVGILILDTALSMVRKMQQERLAQTIMVSSCIIMLCVDFFAWNFSSVSLMVMAAMVSLAIFILKGTPEGKGGEKK